MRTLMRKIRIPPPIPTAEQLRALLREYGVTRWRAAQVMRVAEITFHRYCLPKTSKHHKTIPMLRWETLKSEIDRLDKLYTTEEHPDGE